MNKINALKELEDIYQEGQDPYFDGYLQEPLNMSTYHLVKNFIMYTLPGDLPDPDISIEPNGTIDLEWYCESTRDFVCLCMFHTMVDEYPYKISIFYRLDDVYNTIIFDLNEPYPVCLMWKSMKHLIDHLTALVNDLFGS